MVFFVGPPRVAWRWVVAVGITLGIMKFGMLFIGMHAGLPPGLASLVLQGQAVFTVLFAAVLLKERARRAQIVGMVIASMGIVLAGLDSTAYTVAGFLLVVARRRAGDCRISRCGRRRRRTPSGSWSG